MKTINISNPTYFSAHRSGWGYAMSGLMKYHDNKSILLDDFIDITFGYNFHSNLQKKVIPYKKPWIGFLHHPPFICPWYEDEYKESIDIHNFLNMDVFLASLEQCRGIFVLSEYLKKYLQNNFDQFKNIPIFVLKHPTEYGLYEWDFSKFKKFYAESGIKLIGIGYFLRNLSSIFEVSAPKKIDKILLPSHLEMAISNLEREIAYKNLEIDKTRVKILSWQNNSFYDKILEQSIVFLDLYDTSCNNAIIESIIRNTPLIINKHPATVEYLGEKYPSYYKNIDQVSELLTYDSIQTTAEYLQKFPKLELTLDYFTSEFQTCLSKIETSVNRNKTIKKNNLSIDDIKIKSSKFSHRFGWEWVISNLKEHNPISNHKSSNTMYCNDFMEHTFRSNNQNKSVIINGKRYGLVRGYNLFSSNNTDICSINGRYYVWESITASWKEIELDESISADIIFTKIETYKTNRWSGFLHNPVDMPKWFDHNQNIKTLLHNDDFIESLENCEIIFVLSESLKHDLTGLFDQYGLRIKIKNLKHPVPYTDPKNYWDPNLFQETKNIIQIGYWLRKMHSFWELDTELNKIWLYGDSFAADMIDIENISTGKKDVLSKDNIIDIYKTIKQAGSLNVNGVYLTKTNNFAYDKLLRSSVAYLNFYNCAASNAIVECIASCTPVIVNRLPAIVEYLGEDYPLYFRDIRQASSLSNNYNKIIEAHQYLKDNSKLRDNLSIEKFMTSFYSECQKLCKK